MLCGCMRQRIEPGSDRIRYSGSSQAALSSDEDLLHCRKDCVGGGAHDVMQPKLVNMLFSETLCSCTGSCMSDEYMGSM
jgi:hypothetical protein